MLFSFILMFNQIYNAQKRQHDDNNLDVFKIKKIDNSFDNTYDNNAFISSKNDNMNSSYLHTSRGGIIFDNMKTPPETQNQSEKIGISETFDNSLELVNEPQRKCQVIGDNTLLSSNDFNYLQSFDNNVLFSERHEDVFALDGINSEKTFENKNEEINFENFEVNKVESIPNYTNNFEYDQNFAISCENKKDRPINIFDEDLKKPSLLQSGINHHNYIETFMNQNKRNMITSSEYIKSLYLDVEQYIKYYISTVYQEFYLRRLDDIADIFSSMTKNENNLHGKRNLFSNYYTELEKNLYYIYANFSKDETFNHEVFVLFYSKFNLAMNKFAKFFHFKWNKLSRTEKSFIFQYEFIKLYRFVCQKPEIMTLLNNLKGNLCSDTTFIIHLINVFIKKNGKFGEGNVFIKFLFSRALNFSNSKYPLIQRYSVESKNIHCDFNFFTKEINSPIRLGIEKKTGKKIFT